MKVAIAITTDSEVSAHFGRSPAFLICSVEQGQIQSREVRANDQATPGQNREHQHRPDHSHAHDHNRFVQLLGDCHAVIGLGMGSGARLALEAAGINVRLLEQPCPPDEAALRYASGQLEAHPGSCCGGRQVQQPTQL